MPALREARTTRTAYQQKQDVPRMVVRMRRSLSSPIKCHDTKVLEVDNPVSRQFCPLYRYEHGGQRAPVPICGNGKVNQIHSAVVVHIASYRTRRRRGRRNILRADCKTDSAGKAARFYIAERTFLLCRVISVFEKGGAEIIQVDAIFVGNGSCKKFFFRIDRDDDIGLYCRLSKNRDVVASLDLAFVDRDGRGYENPADIGGCAGGDTHRKRLQRRTIAIFVFAVDGKYIVSGRDAGKGK